MLPTLTGQACSACYDTFSPSFPIVRCGWKFISQSPSIADQLINVSLDWGCSLGVPRIGNRIQNSHANSFLLRQQCPAKRNLCWHIDLLKGGIVSKGTLFVRCCLHVLFSAAQSIRVLCIFFLTFSPIWCQGPCGWVIYKVRFNCSLGKILFRLSED